MRGKICRHFAKFILIFLMMYLCSLFSLPRNDSGRHEEEEDFSPENIDQVESLLSQSEAGEPEDMIRPDLPNAKAVPAGMIFDEKFWKDFFESKDIKEPSLALRAEISGAGECRARVTEVAGQCELAPLHQYWHVAHGKAGLNLHLQYGGLQGEVAEDFIVRAVLFRKQSEYRRFPGV